jgi:deoxyribodipyrimidine photo-lyase
MSDAPVLLWFRQDLRLSDHPALQAAQRVGPVIPVYIFDAEAGAPWAPGAASRWWLHHALHNLAHDLRARGVELIVRCGDSATVLRELLHESGAVRIFASRLYEPALAARDQRLQNQLPLELHAGTLLFEPGEVRTGSGTPYRVFTPFWRMALKQGPRRSVIPAPAQLKPGATSLQSVPLAALKLLPERNWDSAFYTHWQPGEAAAAQKLTHWLNSGLADYAEGRNLPARPGSSRLSPHLHFGEISPLQIWERVHNAPLLAAAEESRRVYLSEIGWREFAHQILHFFPQTDSQPLDARFADFPWLDQPRWLQAWQRGQTGYPIVDAGMRELWTTGWMHNRVRMIVASFLCKDLRLPWQAGARWFWDTLLDANLPANSLNWQWSAGCGADAAPYFRIFNPVSQGEKFDPHGAYVRRWVPELAALPDRWLHRPWEAPPLVLLNAGIQLGQHYPEPIVDHQQARHEALQAFQVIRARSASSLT